MGEVFFYHLTRTPLEGTLRSLLGKIPRRRLARRGARPERGAFSTGSNAALWLGDDAGFVPHGRAGGPHETAISPCC